MKYFIILSIVCACALALPANVDVTQDTLGNYKYLIDTPTYRKLEERHPDGTVTGEYSYPDANGDVQAFKYVSGPEGYRVIDGPVPVAVEHHPEVPLFSLTAPQPVEETPEVQAARAEHLAAHNAQSALFS